MKNKFKVGDRVRCLYGVDGNTTIVGKTGTIRVIDNHSFQPIGVEFDSDIRGHSLDNEIASRRGWWVSEIDIELINDEKIVIYRKDNEVIAKDCITGKIGLAKCDPRDLFNFETGAKLALERLYTEVNKILNQHEDIKTGDKVTVISLGKCYPMYSTWKGLEGYKSHFVQDKEPIPNKVYRVLNIKNHDRYKDMLALIQDEDTTQVFIIGVEGLKKEL